MLSRVASCRTRGDALSKIAEVTQQETPGSVSGGFKLGAGAGFEPATFRL